MREGVIGSPALRVSRRGGWVRGELGGGIKHNTAELGIFIYPILPAHCRRLFYFSIFVKFTMSPLC